METPKLFDLSNNTAIVTGGNGGIGRSIAIGLAQAGASVAIIGRNEQKNKKTLAELKATGMDAMALKVDITKRAELAPAIEKIEKELGAVSILVNNAGIAILSGGILNETEAEWDSTIETHLNATFLISKLVAKSMVEHKRGKIINNRRNQD